ncbi:hypothetical protein TNCV_4726971 [Trichonephila clavipes]|nr:hypothetical protein TNCV_4726971 [Trichonephila clavipes]
MKQDYPADNHDNPTIIVARQAKSTFGSYQRRNLSEEEYNSTTTTFLSLKIRHKYLPHTGFTRKGYDGQ